MIKIINLSKSFGPQIILDEVNLIINPKEKIGLTGRNGHGKTTLIKIITGDEHQDKGEIQIPKGYSIGYLKQHIKFTKNSVIDEGCLGLNEHEKDEKWKVEKILSGLGFSKDDMFKNPLEFSGGFQVRLNLAKVLSGNPDMLLLDEPTNYLDIISIRWLTDFLRQWSKELILITHDRSFMDSVSTHIAGIHRQKIRKIEGHTDKYYEQIAREEEIYEKTRINDDKKRKEIELFVSRFRAKARLAGLVQSRVKALQKQDKLDKLEFIKNLEFTFNYKEFPAKVVMSISDLEFTYTDSSKNLIQNLNITIGKNDRICIIGKNGKGKSTLIKILADGLQPTSGEIIKHPEIKIGYFAQTNILNLNENLTIEEEITYAGSDRQKARNIAGAMIFEGDNALKKIGVLSGGEKSRVLLGKILAYPCNLLLLDEPTNHLDMESCDTLMGAIEEFEGAVMMVTHNELFLHTLANKFIVFQNNEVSVFNGDYQSFLDKIGWAEEEDKSLKENKTTEQSNKKDIRKYKADILSRKTAALKPLEIKIKKTEDEIIESENHISLYNEEIISASQSGNSLKIQELSKKVHSLQSNIEKLYTDLEKISLEHSSLLKGFDAELNSLL